MTAPVYRLDPAAPRHATVIHALKRNAEVQGARDGLVVEERALSYSAYASAVAGLA